MTPKITEQIYQEKKAKFEDAFMQPTQTASQSVDPADPDEIRSSHAVVEIKSLDDTIKLQRAGEHTVRTIPALTRPRRNEVLSRLGQMWRTMTTAEKRPFQEKYEEENKVYQEQVKVYNSSGMIL